MRETKVNIPIYYGYLRIIVVDSEQEMAEVGKKYKHDIDTSKFGAFVWSGHDKKGISEYFVALHEDSSNHLIAHEIVHLVNAVFIHINAQLDRHNDEPQAYLTGWFFKEIEDFLTKKAKA